MRFPQLLVCAPSNAAVDTIQQQLVAEFVNRDGHSHRPRILRVAARGVRNNLSLDGIVYSITGMDEYTRKLRIHNIETELEEAQYDSKRKYKELQVIYMLHARYIYAENN